MSFPVQVDYERGVYLLPSRSAPDIKLIRDKQECSMQEAKAIEADLRSGFLRSFLRQRIDTLRDEHGEDTELTMILRTIILNMDFHH